jgi:hypothetical protein
MEQGKEGPRGEAPCGLGCGDARGRCRSDHHHHHHTLCCTALFLFLFAARTGSRLHSALGVLRTRRCLVKPCPAATKSLQGEAVYHTPLSIHPSYFPPHLVSLIRTHHASSPPSPSASCSSDARARASSAPPPGYDFFCLHAGNGSKLPLHDADADAGGEVSAIRRCSASTPDLPPPASVQSQVGRHPRASRRVQRSSARAALRTADGRARRRRSKDGERGGREGARLLRSTPARARALDGRTRGLKRRGGSAVSRVAVERVGGRDGFYGAGCVGRMRRDAPGMRSRGVVPSPFPPAVPPSTAESRRFVSPACPAEQSPRGLFSTSSARAGVMRTSHAGSMRGRAGRREGGREGGSAQRSWAGIRVPPARLVVCFLESFWAVACDQIKIAEVPLEPASLLAPAWGPTGRARRHLGPSCSRVCRSARTSFVSTSVCSILDISCG